MSKELKPYRIGDVFFNKVRFVRANIYIGQALRETLMASFYGLNQKDMAECAAHAINNHDKLLDQIAQLEKENAELKEKVHKLEFMLDNGLGIEDMRGGTRADVE